MIHLQKTIIAEWQKPIRRLKAIQQSRTKDNPAKDLEPRVGELNHAGKKIYLSNQPISGAQPTVLCQVGAHSLQVFVR